MGEPPSTADRFDLTGKVAVVTGGSRGIGRAVAEGLAGAGADVVIASRKLDRCEEAAAEIAEATGRQALPGGLPRRPVGRLRRAGRGRVRARSVDATCWSTTPACRRSTPTCRRSPRSYYDKVHAVNARGPFRLSSLIGTRMAEGDGGSIINVSTAGSLRPDATDLPYAMAKAASTR